jgi:hypothetical protein
MKKITTSLLLVFLFIGCAGTYLDPNDQYFRGMRFFDRKNFEMAKRDWEPLAYTGDCDAQYRYGTLFFFGAGVPQDFATAHKWLSPAANQGQAFAQMLLATMYAHDYMEHHSPGGMESYFNCLKGCRYEKDMMVAYQWMRLAERYTPYDNFRQFAKMQSEKFKKSLTPQQATKADVYVEQWKPSPAQCHQRKMR